MAFEKEKKEVQRITTSFEIDILDYVMEGLPNAQRHRKFSIKVNDIIREHKTLSEKLNQKEEFIKNLQNKFDELMNLTCAIADKLEIKIVMDKDLSPAYCSMINEKIHNKKD